MDSHAEDDKGGSENESEIGEKLNRDVITSSGLQWRQTHKYTLHPYLLGNEISRESIDRGGPPTYFTIYLI
jgi:hypothetical protein